MFRDSNLLYLVRLSLVNAVELETLGQVFLGYQLATPARSPHLTHYRRTNKAMLFVYWLAIRPIRAQHTDQLQHRRVMFK